MTRCARFGCSRPASRTRSSAVAACARRPPSNRPKAPSRRIVSGPRAGRALNRPPRPLRRNHIGPNGRFGRTSARRPGVPRVGAHSCTGTGDGPLTYCGDSPHRTWRNDRVMAPITAEQVKQLRDKTGAGMMECKAALTEAGGDQEKAVDILRKKGLASAAKRAGRATSNGVVGSYIHMGGKVGVLVEVNCETDFVARTDDFQTLVKELALHIAAADPRYVRREDVPADLLEKEKEIYRAQFADSGKPAPVVEKIVEGKLGSYYSQVVLVDQPYVRDPS